MQIKSSSGIMNGAFNGDLSTRLEELAQKAREKASALKTDQQTPAAENAATQENAADELDFSNAHERSAFLTSLQGGGGSSGVQTGELLTQHSLDPERVAQLLGL